MLLICGGRLPQRWSDCAAVQLPPQLYAKNGAVLQARVEVDATVGLVLCDLDQLDAMCNELIMNWQKYGVEVDGERNVWFRLYKDDKFVALEFGDTFGGQFDLESLGGLGAVKRFCKDYGGTLDSYGPDQNGHKALIMRLRVLPHGIMTHSQ
jgi:hypothetical protein